MAARGVNGYRKHCDRCSAPILMVRTAESRGAGARGWVAIDVDPDTAGDVVLDGFGDAVVVDPRHPSVLAGEGHRRHHMSCTRPRPVDRPERRDVDG